MTFDQLPVTAAAVHTPGSMRRCTCMRAMTRVLLCLTLSCQPAYAPEYIAAATSCGLNLSLRISYSRDTRGAGTHARAFVVLSFRRQRTRRFSYL